MSAVNTCPACIATQDPQLRAKFAGQPERVINFFYYIAEEHCGYVAKLGFRTINGMVGVGRADMLKVNEKLRTPKTAHLDPSAILKPVLERRPGAATYRVRQQGHTLYIRLDNKLIDEAEPTLTQGLFTSNAKSRIPTVRSEPPFLTACRSCNGEEGLPKDTIHVYMRGSAGQSIGAFLALGITIELEGDANDYVGKGLSGGRLIVYPPKESQFKAEENVIIDNVCLYSAGETCDHTRDPTPMASLSAIPFITSPTEVQPPYTSSAMSPPANPAPLATQPLILPQPTIVPLNPRKEQLVTRSSTPSSVSSPLALAASIVAPASPEDVVPPMPLEEKPSSTSPNSAELTIKTRKSAQNLMEPKVVVTPPASPSCGARVDRAHP
jgi:hypothetical protein